MDWKNKSAPVNASRATFKSKKFNQKHKLFICEVQMRISENHKINKKKYFVLAITIANVIFEYCPAITNNGTTEIIDL